MNWKNYESQVFDEFRAKYPDYELLYDQKMRGRHSKVPRQIDIVIKANVADIEMIGVFDCKYFNKKVNVKVIDSMVGFIDDIGARFGGVISVKGFSGGAKNRAKAAGIDLRVITFESPETVLCDLVRDNHFIATQQRLAPDWLHLAGLGPQLPQSHAVMCSILRLACHYR
jgi:hypothetical protein